MEEQIRILEKKIKELETRLNEFEEREKYMKCIGCKITYIYEIPSCEVCNNTVCYSCIGEGAICPRKCCKIMYQMSINTKIDLDPLIYHREY